MLAAKRILIVEDDYFTRFMMREIIRALDVSVDIVESGDMGIERLNAAPDTYGLVLMDIHLPLHASIDAVRNIRAHRSDPPRGIAIVGVTTIEECHDKAFADQYGIDGVLAKPITAGELMGLVHMYCTVH